MRTRATDMLVADDEGRALETRGQVLVALAEGLSREALYVELPSEGELVKRGEVLCRVLTRDGRIVEVTSPVAGRVLEANTGDLRCASWVVRIEPRS